MSMHSVTADRRELLRNGLLETIDHLTRRRASAIPPDFIDDYVARTSTLVRGSHHVTVPGYGIVFGETGRLVSDWNGTTPDESEDDDFVIFEAGLHGASADICEAMG